MIEQNSKLFGTDGVRGIANEEPLTPETLVRLGKAIAEYFNQANGSVKKIVIGKDTRLSGYMLETALTSGLVSMGVDVLLVGPMPTPAIAHLTRSLNADAGIVLSASHNQAQDNGVKIFDLNGIKLGEKQEEEIEKIFHLSAFGQKKVRIGKAFRVDDARGRYIEFVKASIGNESLRGLKIAVDCANGASYSLAQRIFEELGAKVFAINDKPNGENINLECGAVYPDKVSSLVKKTKADVGVAFDGDADRAVFCDENGEVIHGDQVLALFALNLKKLGKLKNDSIVATKISNMGFFEAMRQNQINVIQCDVGDKNVVETMLAKNIVFGGEQSGHIIFSDSSTTGDGLITALHLFNILKSSNKKLSELKNTVKLLPQVNVSVAVKEKKPIEALHAVQKEISEAYKVIGTSGRILVRYSGTEQKARVMVECNSQNTAQVLAEKIASAIKNEIGG